MTRPAQSQPHPSRGPAGPVQVVPSPGQRPAQQIGRLLLREPGADQQDQPGPHRPQVHVRDHRGHGCGHLHHQVCSPLFSVFYFT